MTQIYLVRHGETEWNRLGKTQGGSDIPLNEAGRGQAAATGEALARVQWDRVYASPLERAMETATIIGSFCGFHADAIIPDPRLKERHYGDAEGLTIAERKARFVDNSSIPGAETWQEVRTRGGEAIRAIVRAHSVQRILVVAHGGLIKSILAVVTEGVYSHKTGPLKNAGVTAITATDGGGWRVDWYNKDATELTEMRSHLPRPTRGVPA